MTCVLLIRFELRITCKTLWTGFQLIFHLSIGRALSIFHIQTEYFCRYGSSIIDIKWHQTLNTTKPMLITSDKHIVRVWDPDTVSWLYYFFDIVF